MTIRDTIYREMLTLSQRFAALAERAKEDQTTFPFVGGLTLLKLSSQMLLTEMEKQDVNNVTSAVPAPAKSAKG